MEIKAKSHQSGFTLVELIIVITIVGILSAVAVSKFINIQQQARTAKVQAIYGAVRTAAMLAQSICQLDIAGVSTTPTCTATGGTANMDGTAVSMVNQYPDASLTGIIAATTLDPNADNIIITAGNPILIAVVGASSIATCQVAYTAATPGTAPIISLTTSGC